MGNGLVFLGVPRERTLIPAFVDNRDEVLRALAASGRYCGYDWEEGHRVDMNRDEIVGHFLEHPRAPEWLLQLDSDMEHPADIAERLIHCGKPLVGGLYFYRHDRFQPEAFKFAGAKVDKWDRDIYEWRAMDSEVYAWLAENEIGGCDGAMTVEGCTDPMLPCDAFGAGAMLIHRSILEPMRPPWFEYPHGWSSEDLEFCKRVKEEQGIQPFVDMSTISGHYRYVPVSVAHFRSVYEAINGNQNE